VFVFEPITIFYGSNGSGKSTILNVIAEKLKLSRNSPYNKTDFFDDYCNLCKINTNNVTSESKIITSDDIFKKMNAVRNINLSINEKRGVTREKRSRLQEEIFEDPEKLRFKGMEYYDHWSEYFDAATQATSKYITNRVEKNIAAGSNGETAMKYLTDEIDKNALYLLDEPENSLAPQLQIDLKRFLEESARFFGCQFIIATHSPLLLAMNGAKIYNLDDEAEICNWYELENVKICADFFKEHMDEFI
jgi:predicted ATPase